MNVARIPTKCVKCNENKSPPELKTYPKKDGDFGYNNVCKNCWSIYRKEYKKNNKERIKQKRIEIREKEPVKDMFSNAKARAKRSGLPFTITMEYLQDLYLGQNGKCSLSGIEFEMSVQSEFRISPYRPSLDRIDNSKGYEEGNIRIVLNIINIGLNEFGIEVFMKVFKKIESKMETM